MATATPTRSPVFNLPNQLTASRFVLGIVLFVLIELRDVFDVWLWCAAIFALAAATDWLDGYLARKLQLGSTLGRNLDPLVDKVVICGAYIFLLPLGPEGPKSSGLVPWMVTVVVARELIITGLRGYLENLGAIFGADWLGKLKMGLQCAALFAIFAALQWPQQPLYVVRDVLIYAMLAATTLSGLQYLWKAVTLLRSNTYS
ncbi:MAG TPA: CDP-diacylglycerol--glycerol-3-phosphate 3-phosphatidyltransferase [Gemmataceae bacterium]|nr:CDP-diacylglycerol--glycerol-3-phosphate 3-phosphatidyltransferase [Gemmataceae bacterium]